MKLIISKPNKNNQGLTSCLLQSFLQSQELYCNVKAHHNGLWTFNEFYNFYDFKVLTRHGIGTGFKTPELAKAALVKQLQAVADAQGWKITCDTHAYFEDRFPSKITGIRLWVYIQGEE